ncbi:MAG: polyprenyl synthetase family protein [Pseudomonadota bacterium]|nr:polyprenyl synthetase family protein [Pseudomonadota bacterium]
MQDTASIKELVSGDFIAVDQLIHEQLATNVPLIRTVCLHIIDSGGKRLRPLLVLLIANAFGKLNPEHIKVATIIEFIHTATLLHDDVVDSSALRRGDLTANEKWGNSTSILVGDFLITRAFQLIAGIENRLVMQILAATTNQIAEGEVKQLINRNNADLSEADYFDVIRDKTAMLFQAAAEMTATLCQRSEIQYEAIGRYAISLGIAFQLVDDALDYIGDSDTLGKNTGDDLADGKATLPLIYAMQHADSQDKALIHSAIENNSREHLDAIIATIAKTNAVQYTLDKAKQHAMIAIAELEHLPPSRYRDGLAALAKFSISRCS